MKAKLQSFLSFLQIFLPRIAFFVPWLCKLQNFLNKKNIWAILLKNLTAIVAK
jgi:hypothetical protein